MPKLPDTPERRPIRAAEIFAAYSKLHASLNFTKCLDVLDAQFDLPRGEVFELLLEAMPKHSDGYGYTWEKGDPIKDRSELGRIWKGAA